MFSLLVMLFFFLSMDSVSILVWNVRGLNDKNRRDNLRKVVETSHPAVVCLQETKLAHISDRDVASFLSPEFVHFVYLPAQQTGFNFLAEFRRNFSFFSFPLVTKK